jgi:hypothetical protein
MKPVEPFILIPRPELPDEAGLRAAEAAGRADSRAVRIAAAVVLFTAVASIVWYFVDAVLAL